MEHRDRSRDLANELHVVLHDNDRGGFVEIEHQCGGAGRLLVAHACRGLVEEHNVRFAHYDHRDFDPLTLPVGEFADEAPEDCTDVQSRTVRPFITTGTWFLMPTPRCAIA